MITLFVALGLVGVHLRPSTPAAAGGTVTFNGHGWGHGRGMGQYGAIGYAVNLGWSTGQMLDHYYGGTTAATQDPNQQMSVRMTVMDARPTIAYQEKGQLYTTADDGRPGGRVAHTALKVERVGNNTWQVSDGQSCTGPWTPRAGTVTATAVEIYPLNRTEDRTDGLQLCEPSGSRRWLFGNINATQQDGKEWTSNSLPTDQYVRGVVPREMPASWADLGGGKGMEALKAQAVAARSYATSENRYTYAKTCDTTTCQVYGGRAVQSGSSFTNLEDSRSNTAVAQTAGQVRMKSGAVAHTEFSSSTGGYTAGGTFPAVPDDGDSISINPDHNWSVQLTTASIEAKYGKGTLRSATVTSRNGLGADGGRVLNLHLNFTGGSVDVSGDSFASAFGLKSNWWTPGPVGVSFSGWESLGGNLRTDAAATSMTLGRTDVFSTGPDNAVQHKWEQNGWSNWEWLGGGLNATPAVASMRNGRMDLFGRAGDNQLYHRWYEGQWSAWESLGGALTSAPGAAAFRSTPRVDVFARGTDNTLIHRYWAYPGSGWSAWESLGGTLTSAPSAVVLGDNRVDVFARGTGNTLIHKYWQYPYGWSNWESLGGSLAGAPAAASPASDRLDVFARTANGSVSHITYTHSSGWSGFDSIGGNIVGDAGASSWGPGRLDVFGRGPDNTLQHAWSSS